MCVYASMKVPLSPSPPTFLPPFPCAVLALAPHHGLRDFTVAGGEPRETMVEKAFFEPTHSSSTRNHVFIVPPKASHSK